MECDPVGDVVVNQNEYQQRLRLPSSLLREHHGAAPVSFSRHISGKAIGYGQRAITANSQHPLYDKTKTSHEHRFFRFILA